MMHVELHIIGMKRPFPSIYTMENPTVGDHIVWEFTFPNGEEIHLLQAVVAEINPRHERLCTLLLRDYKILAIQIDPTTRNTNMEHKPHEPQVFTKTVKGERNTCEIKVFLNSELLQLPPRLAGGEPVLEFGHRIEVAIPGTRPLVMTSTSKKLETAIGDAGAIAELFADKAPEKTFNAYSLELRGFKIDEN